MEQPSQEMLECQEALKRAIDHHNNREGERFCFSDFKLIEKLGGGVAGEVWSVMHNISKCPFAIKIINKQKVKEHNGTEYAELYCHWLVKHPNIIKYHTYFIDNFNLYILQEKAATDLRSVLNSAPQGKLPEDTAKKYIFQLASALAECHRKHVIHCDLKPENVCLDLLNDTKLCDFGVARHHSVPENTSYDGTLEYMAPEILAYERVFSPSVDCWALGILAFELLFGRTPFKGARDQEEDTTVKIKKGKFNIPNSVSSAAKEFIRSLLQKDPTKRLSSEEAMQHPWLFPHNQPN